MLYHIMLSTGDEAIVLAGKLVIACESHQLADTVRETGQRLSTILGIPCEDFHLIVESLDCPEEWNWDDVISQLPAANGQYLLMHASTQEDEKWSWVDNVHALNGEQLNHVAIFEQARNLEHFGKEMLAREKVSEAKIGAWYWSASYPGQRFLVKSVTTNFKVVGDMLIKRYSGEIEMSQDVEIQEFQHWKELKSQPKPGELPAQL